MRPESGRASGSTLTIITIDGPYREPREACFSYDYSFQRAHWPTAQGCRVKVSIEHELEFLKGKVLGISGGSPGQQLRTNQLLIRHIADRKFQIADEEGLLSERRDVMLEPFVGPWSHLFPRLQGWMEEAKSELRQEIKDKVGL